MTLHDVHERERRGDLERREPPRQRSEQTKTKEKATQKPIRAPAERKRSTPAAPPIQHARAHTLRQCRGDVSSNNIEKENGEKTRDAYGIRDEKAMRDSNASSFHSVASST